MFVVPLLFAFWTCFLVLETLVVFTSTTTSTKTTARNKAIVSRHSAFGEMDVLLAIGCGLGLRGVDGYKTTSFRQPCKSLLLVQLSRLTALKMLLINRNPFCLSPIYVNATSDTRMLPP